MKKTREMDYSFFLERRLLEDEDVDDGLILQCASEKYVVRK
jgi:hypothetical protein